MEIVVMTNLSLNVPPLADNEIAFLNADAWNAYWAGANFTVNVPSADIGTYGVVEKAITTRYVDPGTTADVTATFADIGAVNHVLPLQSSFDELKTQVTALNAAVKQMRTAMVNAGIITNAQ